MEHNKDEILEVLQYVNSLSVDQQYLSILKQLTKDGVRKSARGHRSVCAPFSNILAPFTSVCMPILRCKKVFLRPMLRELLWFLMGMTNVKYLQDHNVKIWNEWAAESGELGPIYGSRWRSWKTTEQLFTGDHDIEEQHKRLTDAGFKLDGAYEAGETGHDMLVLSKTVDQYAEVFDMLEHNPESKRIVVNAWDAGRVSQMALPPCHVMHQFCAEEISEHQGFEYQLAYTHPSYKGLRYVLHMNVYQRSCDVPLGLPFNLASYATLLHMVAKFHRMIPGAMNYNLGDTHFYDNQYDGVQQQLRQGEAMMAKDMETIATNAPNSAMAAMLWPTLNINVPKEYLDNPNRLEGFDAFVRWAAYLPDEDLMRVFEYNYPSPMPEIKYPISV